MVNVKGGLSKGEWSMVNFGSLWFVGRAIQNCHYHGGYWATVLNSLQ